MRLFWGLLILYLHCNQACIFNLTDPNGYFRIPRRNQIQLKFNYLNEHYSNPKDAKKEYYLKYIDLIAGPFDIADYDGDSSWDHQEQGRYWGEKYSMCNEKRQSPINLRVNYVVNGTGPCLTFTNYNNIHPQMSIVNNGHTVEVDGPWGLKGEDIPLMNGGPLNGNYQLSGVHWHWGGDSTDGAEHAINSRKMPLEMHFVHFNTKYGNVKGAIESGDPEGLAVVGVLFRPSYRKSGRLDTLYKALRGDIIFPATFPLDILKYRTPYYTYLGSLTTPPCSQNVRWIVYEKPLPISSSELKVFRSFRANGQPLVDNFRELQPLNGRKVYRYISC